MWSSLDKYIKFKEFCKLPTKVIFWCIKNLNNQQCRININIATERLKIKILNLLIMRQKQLNKVRSGVILMYLVYSRSTSTNYKTKLYNQ